LLREYLSLDELRRLNWKKIESLQNARLAATAKSFLPHVPFYRKFFKEHRVDASKIKRVEDWKRLGLPLIKEKLYIDEPRNFIVRPAGSRRAMFLNYMKYVFSLNKKEGIKLLLANAASWFIYRLNEELMKEIKSYFYPKMLVFIGGSETGHPVPVHITGRQKTHNMANTADISAYLIISRHLEKSEKEIISMNLFPFAPHTAWHIIDMGAELRSDLNLCTAAGGFLSTEKLIAMAKSAKPNVYSGMAPYMINIFLPRARDEGVRLKGKIVFLNGATKMLEIQRQQIKELFKDLGAEEVVALDGYGASELKEGTLVECEEGSGFHHISPLSNIIRPVKIGNCDPHSEYIYDWDFSKEDEGGYAAIWNIDGAGTLLAGYLLGDYYEKISTDPCPHCGLSVMRVYGINRICDLETEMKIMGLEEEKVSGARVNLSALKEHLLHLKELEDVQLVVNHGVPRDQLIVKYVPRTDDDKKIHHLIREVFLKFSEIQPSAVEKIDLPNLYSDIKLKPEESVRKDNEHGIH
jgi:phenylacetate-coenzyme A ligase PaaK-like adenylate-forming protein